MDRGIELLREGAPILDADQLPEVPAGNPIVGEEHTPPRLHDFDSLAGQFEARPDYFLRIKGDSLDKVGFHTGDVIAIKRTPEATEGDLVVARIGQEIALKRYCRKSASVIELQPESSNPEHKPIRIDRETEDFEIVGVVVGAIVGRATPRRLRPTLNPLLLSLNAQQQTRLPAVELNDPAATDKSNSAERMLLHVSWTSTYSAFGDSP